MNFYIGDYNKGGLPKIYLNFYLIFNKKNEKII